MVKPVQSLTSIQEDENPAQPPLDTRATENYDQVVEAVRLIVHCNPEAAAKVLKGWLDNG